MLSRTPILGALALLAAAPVIAQEQPMPSWQEAYRFLNHSTFGPTRPEVDRLRIIGYDAWLKEQFETQVESYPAYLNEKPVEWAQDYFFQNAIQAPDQMRQRVAFALHKIFVVSANDVQDPMAVTSYLRLLHDNAFDNVYVLLKRISLHPAMGEYLDMVNNDKADPAKGIKPNENYARELMQLFSIGLTELNPDGTAKRGVDGETIPAYTEDDVKEFTRALTGWTYAPRNGRAPRGHTEPYYEDFMVAVESLHDIGAKRLFGNELPANQTATQDLDSVIGTLYWHPNIAPFLSKQLIQQLVTSNPSPQYVRRVSGVFEDNGHGVRGDMRAITRAILLDPEALTPPENSTGHLKEPALLVSSLMRAVGGQIEDHPFLANESTEMGQKILFPPSVFSYFSPEYRVAASGGTLMGPEFQILTTETALRRVNYAAKLIYGGFGSDVKVDISRFVERGNDMDALLNMVDEDILGGEMPATMREIIQKAVQAQRGAQNKARTALYLAATSPLFQVIR